MREGREEKKKERADVCTRDERGSERQRASDKKRPGAKCR